MRLPTEPYPWTAGEWEVRDLPREDEQIILASPLSEDADYVEVAVVCDSRERDANGRLLRAAPELFEVLEELVDEVRATGVKLSIGRAVDLLRRIERGDS